MSNSLLLHVSTYNIPCLISYQLKHLYYFPNVTAEEAFSFDHDHLHDFQV